MARTGRAHTVAKRSVNFAQTEVLRRSDRVDSPPESRFDRSFRNPKGFKGFDEAKKPLRRNVALGNHRFLTLLDRGVDDVARNERENAIPHSSRGAVGEEFVKVAFVGNSVASFLGRPIMRNEKEEGFQNVRFLIPSKGADFRHIVEPFHFVPTAFDVAPVPRDFLRQTNRRPGNIRAAARVRVDGDARQAGTLTGRQNSVRRLALVARKLFR